MSDLIQGEVTYVDGADRDGGWIQTATGGQFWPTDPRAEEIMIEDVAHALSRINRFTGHILPEFYTVAEHCCRVSDLLCALYPGERRLHLEGLLHDAPEFSISDLNTPLKRDPLLRGYKLIEERIRLAFAERFGLPAEPDPRVKEADLVLLATEQRDVMASSRHAWKLSCDPLREIIYSWSPTRAKREFLRRYMRLVTAHARCTDCGAKMDSGGEAFVRAARLPDKPGACPACDSPYSVSY